MTSLAVPVDGGPAAQLLQQGHRLTLAATATAAGLFAAACGGSAATGGDTGPRASASSDTATAPATESSQPEPSSSTGPDGVAITTAGSDYGAILFDQLGQAIYLFEKETAGRPDCYGACAGAWPPVLTNGTPQATDGTRAELLGTVSRDDGSTQVTYAGHPLYYYVHDGPHQVLCHDVTEFGGRWLVVTPQGTPAP
jgi:predicted lipoprotein with Yx(FWY)xxD motif